MANHLRLKEISGKITGCQNEGIFMYQLSFYVPQDHLEVVKNAVFDAGGGKIGNYDSCCFEYEGVGQFRPLKGSNAFIGSINLIEKVRETKVELAVDDHLIEQVISALKTAHPYETPAYFVFKSLDI